MKMLIVFTDIKLLFCEQVEHLLSVCYQNKRLLTATHLKKRVLSDKCIIMY